MPVDEFGGDWTAEKLERVRKYLAAYTVIFARNPKAQKTHPNLRRCVRRNWLSNKTAPTRRSNGIV